MNLRHILIGGIGGIEALLIARLVLRLLAARPDNPIVRALFALTAPPRALAFFDRGQPQFGATLEIATLALILLLPLAGLAIARLWSVRTTEP
jgi:hypothetical protein